MRRPGELPGMDWRNRGQLPRRNPREVPQGQPAKLADDPHGNPVARLLERSQRRLREPMLLQGLLPQTKQYIDERFGHVVGGGSVALVTVPEGESEDEVFQYLEQLRTQHSSPSAPVQIIAAVATRRPQFIVKRGPGTITEPDAPQIHWPNLSDFAAEAETLNLDLHNSIERVNMRIVVEAFNTLRQYKHATFVLPPDEQEKWESERECVGMYLMCLHFLMTQYGITQTLQFEIIERTSEGTKVLCSLKSREEM